jgi:hypothetical protein
MREFRSGKLAGENGKPSDYSVKTKSQGAGKAAAQIAHERVFDFRQTSLGLIVVTGAAQGQVNGEHGKVQGQVNHSH